MRGLIEDLNQIAFRGSILLHSHIHERDKLVHPIIFLAHTFLPFFFIFTIHPNTINSRETHDINHNALSTNITKPKPCYVKYLCGLHLNCPNFAVGLELLKKGIVWRVGDGTKIRIWRDPCLPRPPSYKPISQPRVIVGLGRWLISSLKVAFGTKRF
jgi:hypothetical protein